VILALYNPKADGDDTTPRPNFEHVYFAVDDLEAVYRPFGNPICFVDAASVFTGRPPA
jgi:hypothetical protein